MSKICFVDLETTGVDPARHELWEIGIVIRDENGEQECSWQLAADLTNADPAALRIGGYYSRNRVSPSVVGWALCTAFSGDTDPPSRECAAQVVASTVAHLLDGAVLVAANVAFDAAFLDRFLRRHSYAPAWDYHLVEIESYAAGALGLEPPWKLNHLLDEYGIKVAEEDRHTALGDARAVRELYDAARQRLAGSV